MLLLHVVSSHDSAVPNQLCVGGSEQHTFVFATVLDKAAFSGFKFSYLY